MKLKFLESDEAFAKRTRDEYSRLTNIANALKSKGRLELGLFERLDWIDAAAAVIEKRDRMKLLRAKGRPKFCHGTVAQIYLAVTNQDSPAKAMNQSEAISWVAQQLEEAGVPIGEEGIKKALQRQGVIGKRGT